MPYLGAPLLIREPRMAKEECWESRGNCASRRFFSLSTCCVSIKRKHNVQQLFIHCKPLVHHISHSRHRQQENISARDVSVVWLHISPRHLLDTCCFSAPELIRSFMTMQQYRRAASFFLCVRQTWLFYKPKHFFSLRKMLKKSSSKL